TPLSTLSLHDALPISFASAQSTSSPSSQTFCTLSTISLDPCSPRQGEGLRLAASTARVNDAGERTPRRRHRRPRAPSRRRRRARSEEHTSELQSRSDL